MSIATKPIYTDTTGLEWRTFEDWMEVPADRIIAADLAVRRASMGLSPERLVQAFREIKEELNKGDIIKGYAMFDQLERRIADIPDESLLQELALIYILHPDENPEEYKPSYQRMKLNLWQSDEDARFFFILMAVRFITSLSNISDDVIRMHILQRALTESTEEDSQNIFPLSVTGLMNQ